MRILLLTHRLPFPPNKGDKIRSFNILNQLRQRHEVYLVSVVDDDADLKYIPELQARLQQVAIDCISDRSRVWAALHALSCLQPITVSYFHSVKLQEQFDALLERHEFDAVFCFSSPMAEYLFKSRHWSGKLRGMVKIMDLIDVDSYKWRQYAARSLPPRSWIYRYEARRLAAYETSIAREFDHLLVVSEQERNYFPGSGATVNLHAMSNGVDLSFFSPVHTRRAIANRHGIVFTGVMDYWPNVEGVQWFVERIFPHIRAVVPDARFYIVGSKPDQTVRRLAQTPGVVVTGFVEDVRDYLAGADVCVVPLRIARGIQNKVLEAMAMSKAIVCSPQAFEGIHAEAGQAVAVAADEPAFAAAVVDLLLNPDKARQRGQQARLCVEEHYSWQKTLRILTELLSTDDLSPMGVSRVV